jgi:hypothetical protein
MRTNANLGEEPPTGINPSGSAAGYGIFEYLFPGDSGGRYDFGVPIGNICLTIQKTSSIVPSDVAMP